MENVARTCRFSTKLMMMMMINRHKTTLLGFVIIASAAMYALYLPWSPPGECIKHLESHRVAVMHSVKNRSDVIFKNFNAILSGYNRSINTGEEMWTTAAIPLSLYVDRIGRRPHLGHI